MFKIIFLKPLCKTKLLGPHGVCYFNINNGPIKVALKGHYRIEIATQFISVIHGELLITMQTMPVALKAWLSLLCKPAVNIIG